jgi:hypothetical protein
MSVNELSLKLLLSRHGSRDDMSAGEQHSKPSRQGRIFGGYLLACLASGVALAIASVVLNEITSLSIKPKWRIGVMFGDAVTLTFFIAPVILTATFLPATLVGWWSERRAERRFVVYALVGMLMAIFGSTIFFSSVPDFTIRGFAPQWIMYGPAGFIAGATYWLIAGRSAGVGWSRRS